MPKLISHALTWCLDSPVYKVRDLAYANALVAVFWRDLAPSSECFEWLADISSFAFERCADQYAARRETKQRGECYEFAYQRTAGQLRKKYYATLLKGTCFPAENPVNISQNTSTFLKFERL